MKQKILIADDERHIREILQAFLEKSGYETAAFNNGQDLIDYYQANGGDCIILDIMMPGLDGYQTLHTLRNLGYAPIIMVSAKSTEQDKITALKGGSDDYMTKPFSPMELVARVEALIRRHHYPTKKTSDAEAHYGNLTFFTDRKEVTVEESILSLTGTEYAMLHYLCLNKDRAVSRGELLEKIWGMDGDLKTRVTDDTLKRLRKKLSDANANLTINTIWGFGFILKRTDEA